MLYEEVSRQILAVLANEDNRIAQMATLACLLAQAFPENIWTGFYLVDPTTSDELVVGPYQGTLGCLRIPYGKGVCGVAAATRETQVIVDVHSFSGHIACDSRSASEIVIPIIDATGTLIAVLDIDNPLIGAFDNTDQLALEALTKAVFSR